MVPTTLSFPRVHGISPENLWFPGQTSPSPSSPFKCRRSGSRGHSHGPFVPTQAGLLPNALTSGSCQPDWGGGAPLLCLPHPSFPDTSCLLQVLGARSADTDRIWASLSIHFLLTSALKSLKLKTRAVRPRAWNEMTSLRSGKSSHRSNSKEVGPPGSAHSSTLTPSWAAHPSQCPAEMCSCPPESVIGPPPGTHPWPIFSVHSIHAAAATKPRAPSPPAVQCWNYQPGPQAVILHPAPRNLPRSH